MASTAQNALPLQSQRLDIFSHPTQDQRAKDKARQLLREILPKEAWWELEDRGVIKITGQRGQYVISPYAQTEIRDIATGRCVAYACLQLTIEAPTYDRMVAEYLLIKNVEDVYWKIANIFSRSHNEFSIAKRLLIVLDIAMFVNLLIVTAR